MIDLIPGVTFSDAEKQVYGSIAGTVLGALLAFLLVVGRDRFSAISSRKKKHYDTLVKLNRQLQIQAVNIQDNLYILPLFSESLKRGEVYYNPLRRVEFDRNIMIDLHNLELENTLMTYYDHLSHDSDDYENLQKAFDSLKDAYLNGALSTANYESNVAELAVKMDMLFSRVLKDTLELNATSLASVNKLLDKDQTLGMKFDHWVVGQNKLSDKDIKVEASKIYKRYKAKIRKRYAKPADK